MYVIYMTNRLVLCLCVYAYTSKVYISTLHIWQLDTFHGLYMYVYTIHLWLLDTFYFWYVYVYTICMTIRFIIRIIRMCIYIKSLTHICVHYIYMAIRYMHVLCVYEYNMCMTITYVICFICIHAHYMHAHYKYCICNMYTHTHWKFTRVYSIYDY